MMPSQRDMVTASLLSDAARETHRDVYSRRRPRLLPDPISIREVSRSINDLGALLAVATSPEERSWLTLRLRNRLDALDALDGRG